MRAVLQVIVAVGVNLRTFRSDGFVCVCLDKVMYFFDDNENVQEMKRVALDDLSTIARETFMRIDL